MHLCLLVKIPPCVPSGIWKPKAVLLLPGFCTRTLQLLGTSRSSEVREVKTIILTKNLEVFRQRGCDGRTSFTFWMFLTSSLLWLRFPRISPFLIQADSDILCRLWSAGWRAAGIGTQLWVGGSSCPVPVRGLSALGSAGGIAWSVWILLVPSQGLILQKH